MTLQVDIFEPTEKRLPGQPVVHIATKYFKGVIPFEVSSLNAQGYADYLWTDIDGKQVQVERKQWGEVIGDLESVENQLRNHLTSRPECKLLFLLEGMVIGTSTGTATVRSTNKNNIFVIGRETTIRLTQLYSWLYQISNFIAIYQTSTYYETCLALTSFYKGDQKTEHTTFTRHFKPINYHYDPRVVQLMGLLPGIGEVKAEALINKFITVWNVVSAMPKELEQVDGIGKTLSVKILRQIGRTDV